MPGVPERVRPTPFRGRKLLILDFSNCAFDEAANVVAEACAFIDKQPPKSLLTLGDFTNARIEPRFVTLIGEFAKANEPFVKAGAAVGLTGAQRGILDAVNNISKRAIRAFDHPVRAKNWLVEQNVRA